MGRGTALTAGCTDLLLPADTGHLVTSLVTARLTTAAWSAALQGQAGLQCMQGMLGSPSTVQA